MTPETALSLIPGFQTARLGMVFADGVTAKTVLVELLDSKFVLRIDKPEARQLGIDRIKDEEICRLAAAAGISPQPVLYDHENGICLRQFVGGTNWVVSDFHSKKRLKRLARLLRRVHGLPAVRSIFSPDKAIEAYAAHIGSGKAKSIADKALSRYAPLKSSRHEECLCHNDLIYHNILESDTDMLIDWEFAGMGDPWFDIAVVVHHHGLHGKFAEFLMSQYLERAPSKGEMERLDDYVGFYVCLLELWNMRTGGELPGSPVLVVNHLN